MIQNAAVARLAALRVMRPMCVQCVTTATICTMGAALVSAQWPLLPTTKLALVDSATHRVPLAPLVPLACNA